MWYLSPAKVLKLEHSSEHAQLLNSKDSSQIECSVLFLHQRAIYIYIYIYIYVYIYIYIYIYIPTHDSLLLRVSCLRTHQTVFKKENSYHLVYIQACEKLLLFA